MANSSRSKKHSGKKRHSRKHHGRRHQGRKHRHRKHRRHQVNLPPPDFPSSPYPLRPDGGLTGAAQDNAVVSIASQYLGVPYLWGGASPKTGFDCSGLVSYVFGLLGVSLPHYAAAQWYSPDAVWIPPERLQAGDLVFFTGSDGSREAPGHVGIYVGDGYLVDAPHTGSSVRIDSLDEQWFANTYVGAKRILGVPAHARRLLHVSKPEASATAGSGRGLPPPPIVDPLGESLRIAAVGTPAARTAHRSHWIWPGVGIGVLFLLLLTGSLVAHRRRRLAVAPSAAPSA